MSGQQIVLNSVPDKPTLSDLLDLLKKEIFFDLNCHHIATVQSFNATAQTVKATVNYSRTFFQLNTATNLYQAVQVNYPVAVDAPAIVLQGGGSWLNLPIKAGDTCLLLFNDRDMDNWYSSGQTGQPVASSRAHSFADAIALVGLGSVQSAFAAFDTSHASLTNGNAVVGFNTSNNKVTLKNSSVGTLNSVLQNIMTQIGNLCTALEALTVTCAAPGNPSSPPVNVAAITMVATQLSTYATQLGNLLE